MDYQQGELMDIPEIDQDLLMELLDDKEETFTAFVVDPLEEGNNWTDQLPVFSNAGVLLNSDLIHDHEDCEDCSLDDMLSSIDCHECLVSSTNHADNLLYWVEMDDDIDMPQGVIDDQWQLDGLGCNSFYYGTGDYVEQDFCPSWE